MNCMPPYLAGSHRRNGLVHICSGKEKQGKVSYVSKHFEALVSLKPLQTGNVEFMKSSVASTSVVCPTVKIVGSLDIEKGRTPTPLHNVVQDQAVFSLNAVKTT